MPSKKHANVPENAPGAPENVPENAPDVAQENAGVPENAPAGAPNVAAPETPVSAALKIVWRDEHLLVVDKPAGLVVHPARGHREGTLSQLLADTAAGGEPERAGIVHRLDRDTSGLLVVACSEEAHRLLQASLRERRVQREYLALVEGRPPARTGTIEAPIGRHPRIRTRMAVGGVAAREARTHFTLERSLKGVSLLRLRLDTGRTHQIRVHLQAIEHPVCGDPEYGTAGVLGLTRQFLHATRLAFPHPITGEPLDVSSPLPADLSEALRRAEGDSGWVS
jgi:23S rRNA pseudouridine1911/1915/1917 synthase